MSGYYDLDGSPIGMMEWATLMEADPDVRRVAQDTRDDVTVSTVWLGLDHNYGDGPPLIFETMVFGGAHDQYTERYSTREQAVEGHAQVVALALGVATS